MKIVITNDDGIDARGLDTLYQCVRQLGEIVIVAPQHAQSGIAHRVTTRDPIRINQLEPNRHSVDGTPADCARIALKVIAPGAGWLISGINAGANLGSDVYNSGTVAAAREAAILGYRAIAVSQYIAKDQKVDWSITGDCARPVLQMLLSRDLAPGHFWNVNLPSPIRMDSESRINFVVWISIPINTNIVKAATNYSMRVPSMSVRGILEKTLPYVLMKDELPSHVWRWGQANFNKVLTRLILRPKPAGSTTICKGGRKVFAPLAGGNLDTALRGS